MPVSQTGTGITFNDSTTQTTATTTNGIVSVGYYSSSQTITIPTGATRAVVSLIGGGANGCGGGGNGLRKYLTGLTPGATLALTVGGAGSGTSQLSSGNQTIGTLIAYGGRSGSIASGGDLNVLAGGGGICTDRNYMTGYPGQSAFGYGSNGGGWGAGGPGGTSGGCEIFWYK